MAKRTEEEWWQFISEQAESGLTVGDFCRGRGINAKYFYLRRKQLSESSTVPFVPVQLLPPSSGDIHVGWQGTLVRLPSSLSPQWVADFIKQLAA